MIEAENVKSSIDTEAEFNRDPALVRYRLLTVLALAVMGAFFVFLSRTGQYADYFRDDANEFIKDGIQQREEILKEKTQFESLKNG